MTPILPYFSLSLFPHISLYLLLSHTFLPPPLTSTFISHINYTHTGAVRNLRPPSPCGSHWQNIVFLLHYPLSLFSLPFLSPLAIQCIELFQKRVGWAARGFKGMLVTLYGTSL